MVVGVYVLLKASLSCADTGQELAEKGGRVRRRQEGHFKVLPAVFKE